MLLLQKLKKSVQCRELTLTILSADKATKERCSWQDAL